MPSAVQELTSRLPEKHRRELDRLVACLCAIGVVSGVIAVGRPARALGVLVAETSDSSIKASRTIFARAANGNTFQMTEIHFESSDWLDFVWVLPVEAEGDDINVVECDGARFEEVAKIAQPRILLRQREAGEGCGGSDLPGPRETSIGDQAFSLYSIEHDPRTHAPFEDIEALEEWLVNIGGYPIQGSNHGVLAHYVANTFHFIAVEVVPEKSTGRVCLELEYAPPAQREYDFLLPMRTGSVSSEEPEPVSTEILMYALGSGTVRPLTKQDGGAVYRAVTLNLHEISATGESTTDYDEVFSRTVGDPPGFVIEYSGTLPEPLDWTQSADLWLTRLRTRMNPSQLTGPDLALQIDEPEDVSRDYSIVVAQAGRRVDPTVALCAIVLFGALLVRRRPGER